MDELNDPSSDNHASTSPQVGLVPKYENNQMSFVI
jgi:hypothetical protein